MIIDFSAIQSLQRYHLLTQTVIPRPIAWVLSQNDDLSNYNLAPFSFFNAICSDPPLLVLSIGKKLDGSIKDTRRNILSGREFVVHIASLFQAETLNASAAALDYGESELEGTQLSLVDLEGCAVPRIAEALVAYHCTLYDVHELGPNQQAIIYAQIHQLYLDDTIVKKENDRLYIDAVALDPLARLGATEFSGISRPFAQKRPG